MADFLLVPHFEIFETACLAREQQSLTNSCLVLFRSAWSHHIDTREKFIWISQELNQHLVEKKYKSNKEKRLALFSILRVYDEPLGDEGDFALARLTSTLSVNQNKKIYYVIDNPVIKEMMQKTLAQGIEVIDSKTACQKIKELNAKA